MEEANPPNDPPTQDPNPPETAPSPPSQPPAPPPQQADPPAPCPSPPPPPEPAAEKPAASAAAKPPLPPAAAAGGPPKNNKRPLDNNVKIQDTTYFKIRTVLKDIRPHLIEVLGTVDFRCGKGADELRERLKLLMELYKEMTAEAVITKKPKFEPGGQHLSSENGAAQKKQLQDVKPTEQPQSDHVFAKPSEKEAVDLEEQPCYIGGSAFGWNFITFPGNKPVFYGRTKEVFRAAQMGS